MSAQTDENTLLWAVAAGNRAAFTRLYTLHLDALFQYACAFVSSKEEAEEIVQEVFVRIWERRATLPQLQCFRAYAFQITKHLLVDYWRQQKRHARLQHQQQHPAYEAVAEPADAALLYQQDYQMAQEAIARLPRKRQQIFLMRTQQELSLDEIAQQLTISKSVVKKQLYAATAFVRAYLHRHGHVFMRIMVLFALMQASF